MHSSLLETQNSIGKIRMDKNIKDSSERRIEDIVDNVVVCNSEFEPNAVDVAKLYGVVYLTRFL